jgi:predicted nucleic acid-binding protein
MTLVIDASVVVKWFVEEELADEAASLLRGSPSLHAPDLIVSEVTNALWKKFTRGHITREQAEGIAAVLPRSLLQLVPSISLHQRALDIAMEMSHPVYDCLYVACAENVEGSVITADRRFHAATRGGPYAGLVRHLSDLPP